MVRLPSAVIAGCFLLGTVPFANGQRSAEGFGQIAVRVSQNGAPASGTFVVYRLSDGQAGAAGTEVARGQSGSPVNVPVGRHDVVVRLDGAVDRPEHWIRGVEVIRGQARELREGFATGVLEVRVTAQGRPAAARVYVHRAGEEAELGRVGAGVRATLSAGRFDIQVRYRTQDRWLRGVDLPPGSSRSIDVAF